MRMMKLVKIMKLTIAMLTIVLMMMLKTTGQNNRQRRGARLQTGGGFGER